MASKPNLDVFKRPTASWESKHEATSRAANEIMKTEANAATAKLDRLRAARLAQEAAAPAAPVVKAKRARAKA